MLVGGTAVPVDGDEINVAALALVEELLQPVEAGGRDGGRSELGVALEGLHVLSPAVHGIVGGHVRLVITVGLIEGQKMATAALVDPVPGIVEPLAGVVVLGAPEHGHVLGKVGLLVRVAVPVVLPVDLGLVAEPASAKLPDGHSVVGGKTTLGPRVGRGSGKHESCPKGKG